MRPTCLMLDLSMHLLAWALLVHCQAEARRNPDFVIEEYLDIVLEELKDRLRQVHIETLAQGVQHA